MPICQIAQKIAENVGKMGKGKFINWKKLHEKYGKVAKYP